jgi:hypothetical protein
MLYSRAIQQVLTLVRSSCCYFGSAIESTPSFPRSCGLPMDKGGTHMMPGCDQHGCWLGLVFPHFLWLPSCHLAIQLSLALFFSFCRNQTRTPALTPVCPTVLVIHVAISTPIISSWIVLQVTRLAAFVSTVCLRICAHLWTFERICSSCPSSRIPW